MFVSIAAPGLVPLKPPPLTHSRPSRTPNRSLGKLPNGKYFGERQFDVTTPFNFVSAKESTKDLLASKLTTISRGETCEEKPLGNNLTNQTTSTVRSKLHEISTTTYIEDKQYISFSSITYQINRIYQRLVTQTPRHLVGMKRGERE